MISPAAKPGQPALLLLVVGQVEQIVQHQVVLQADREPEGQCVDARDLLADHHPVAIVGLAGSAVLLTDLQRVDAGLGRPGEHLAVDPVLAVPIVLVWDDFPSQELAHRFPVGLVVGPIERPLHRSEPLDDGDVGLPAALAHGLQAVPTAGAFEFVQQ